MMNLRLFPVAFAVVLGMTVGWQGLASAAQIATYNFDNDPLGSTPPTTAPNVDAIPQGHIYSIGGFPDIGPVTGTVTVQNVGSLSHAAVMETSQGGTGALFIDTQFLVPASFASIKFSLNVMDVPEFVPQASLGAPNGQAFVLQMFGLDSVRFWRFAVSPTSETTGNFGMRLPGSSGELLTIGTYNEGETHDFEIRLDFGTDLSAIYMDGVLKATTPFTAPATGMSELFIFQNGTEGQTNRVAIDNISISVPDQGSTAALLGLGVLGMVWLRSRQCAAANA